MKNLSSRGLLCRLPRPLAALGLLLAVAGAAHAQAPAPTFAPAVMYGTGAGANPISLAVADVNNDGQRDLLTSNFNTSTFVVLLGTGTGTFQPAATYSTGGFGSYSIAVADVNGDGQLDLLTANGGSNNIGVLLGNGNGTFQPVVKYGSGGSTPNSIAVADVNGDGQLDLLVTNGRSNNIVVLLGTGTGTFQLAATYSTGGAGPRSSAVADVNGDGQLDLLVTNEFSGTAGVLLGTGTGTFQPAAAYSTGGASPRSIAVADVNGDGQLDLLATNFDSNSAGVLLGNGNGTFQSVVTYSTGGSSPQDIAVADVNGDGQLDLLATNRDSNTIGVLLGNGTGTFQPAVTYGSGGTSPYDIVATDVNGDGKLDLLTPNFNSGNVGVLLNTTVPAPTLTGVAPTAQYAGQIVTLRGTNLTGATAVLFNDTFNNTTPATFVVVNATTIRATVPNGIGPKSVSVVTPGGTSNSMIINVIITIVPTVSTTAPSGLMSASATLGGEVTAEGAAPVTDRGVVYSSTNQAPLLNGPGVSQQTMGAGTGPFSQLVTGLTPGATYTVRAYATNSVGTSYGNAVTFTTPCAPPVLTVPANQTLAADAGQCGATRTFAATATGSPTPTLGYAVNGTPITFPYAFPVGTTLVTVTADNNCGSPATGSFTVTVLDQQAPVARTRNITVVLTGSTATITAAQVNNGSSDNCTNATALGLSVSLSTFTCANLGANQVTLTVRDAAGNPSTATAIVTVLDQQAPVARTRNITVALVNGQVTVTAAQLDNGSTDNCGIATRSISPSTFTCANLGANQVTLTVTDASNNVSTATATVTVDGFVPQPSISVSPSSTLYLGFGPQTATLTASGGGPNATYQWRPTAGLSAPTSATTTFTATTAGSFPFTVTVTSASGCVATATVTLTVEDVQCGNKSDKVQLCHNGQTICVAPSAVSTHLAHGDQLGSCSAGRSTAASSSTGSALAPATLEAYPNPFSSSTTVRFRAVQAGTVQVQVYNSLGQPVVTLYEGPIQAGQLLERTVTGTQLSAGLYTVRLTGSGQPVSQRLVLTK